MMAEQRKSKRSYDISFKLKAVDSAEKSQKKPLFVILVSMLVESESGVARRKS